MTLREDTSEVTSLARGDVFTRWTGRLGDIELPAVRNSVSYSAADAIAAAYGGDLSLAPRFIGFMYGQDEIPQGISNMSDRNMRWDDLRSEAAACGANVLVSGFSSPATVSTVERGSGDDAVEVTGPGSVYTGNAVTFHAVTRSGSAGRYAFDTSGGTYAVELADGHYMYHALLLGLPRGKTEEEAFRDGFRILGRVALSRGGFRAKPQDYELAVDWRVSFF